MNSVKLQDTKSIYKKSLYILAIKNSIKIKYLGICLPKEVKDLYTVNFKTSFKEIKEDLNKWEDIYDNGLEDLTLTTATLLKLIYRFIIIPIKIPPGIWEEINKLI